MADGDIRLATPHDIDEIWQCIHDLAEYEKSLDHVQITPTQLGELLFGGTATEFDSATHHASPAAWCHVVEYRDDTCQPPRTLGGFALWFLNTSTWSGRHGIYLEDLYVRPELRGLGYGRRLLATLAALCVKNDYARLEWWVLDWNTPAIEFYRSLGAEAMDEWTVFRITGDALPQLANRVDSVDP